MGSVLLLWGDPGDLAVELLHLKQPVEDIGPLTVIHDHHTGVSKLERGVDLLDLAASSGSEGITVRDAASRLYTTAQPSRNEIEKARRRLDALTRKGDLRRHDDPDGTARYLDPLRLA
jgi:hypothetical protein